ncbi:E3 ubiquitin-protein ligase rnf13 [Linnemannia elongata]|nr:E3 ubiquitin-protein ligase rnf13 [Linnemannia elongata]KAG0065599.1 E3 ubiquitin-protein ligase rnf13 [Linnemannia elongata]
MVYRGRKAPALGSLFTMVLLLVLVALSLSSNSLTHAAITTIMKLNYDFVSVENRPETAASATLIAKMPEFDRALYIKNSGEISQDGFSGILFDMGYGCQGLYQNYTLNQTGPFVPQRVALIKRAGPPGEKGCSFQEKMLSAMRQNAVAFLVYNNETYNELIIDDAGDGDIPNAIPGILLRNGDGMMLRTWLQNQTLLAKDPTNPQGYNRIRINLTVTKRMSVIWEVVLIVVVILLAVSLAISVILHCRLYALRQRIRMDALARGADVLPNGTIRMRKVTINKAILDTLPIRIHGQIPPAPIAAVPVVVQDVTPTTTQERTSNESSAVIHVESTQDSGVESAHNPTVSNTTRTSTSASRANSIRQSISGRSVSGRSISGHSVRSQNAIAAATALESSTAATTAQTAGSSSTAHIDDDDSEDACAICLDEFEDGEEIRSLPCHHEFHCDCIDPWLVRKSSTCPLCKFDCLPQTEEEAQGRGEDANIVLPHDRLIEFIMGPDWVAARTMRGHNGTSTTDRIGHFFDTVWDRMRGRSPRPMPGATVQLTPRQPYSRSAAPSAVQLDEHGQVPLQFITPRGVSSAPAASSTRTSLPLTTPPVPAPAPAVVEETRGGLAETPEEPVPPQTTTTPSVIVEIPASSRSSDNDDRSIAK